MMCSSSLVGALCITVGEWPCVDEAGAMNGNPIILPLWCLYHEKLLQQGHSRKRTCRSAGYHWLYSALESPSPGAGPRFLCQSFSRLTLSGSVTVVFMDTVDKSLVSNARSMYSSP
eukprot:scaffold260510_cov26-Prasinocladus_malaysianus.AAC.2